MQTNTTLAPPSRAFKVPRHLSQGDRVLIFLDHFDLLGLVLGGWHEKMPIRHRLKVLSGQSPTCFAGKNHAGPVQPSCQRAESLASGDYEREKDGRFRLLTENSIALTWVQDDEFMAGRGAIQLCLP